MPNLILVDKRIHHHEDIINAVNVANNVHCILFDGFNMSSDDIRSKIQALNIPSFACVGLVQHNNNAPFYQMFGPNSQMSTVLDVESRDASLQSWSEPASFVGWLKTSFGVQYFDMMACAIYSNPDWKYVIDKLSGQTGVELRASTDNTGSSKLGGNWFLESHNGVDLKTVYFTDAIDRFEGILFNSRQYNNKSGISVINGSVVTWGRNSTGGDSSAVASQLTSGVVSIYSTGYAFAALKSDGSVVTWGDYNSGSDSSAVASQLTSGVVSIYSTSYAFAALKSDGSVVTWGSGTQGGDSITVASQLTSGVVSIYSASFSFAALKSDGSVVTWGDSYNGGNSSAVASQLTSGVVSIYSSENAYAALKSDGSVVTWGYGSYGGDSSAVASQLTSGVVSIYSGLYAFSALKSDGSVVTWGSSFYGGDSSAVASQLTSGVVSIYSNETVFAAIKTTSITATLAESYFTNIQRYVILSNATTKYKYDSNVRSGVFAISPQDLNKLNIPVPAIIGTSPVADFKILVPAAAS